VAIVGDDAAIVSDDVAVVGDDDTGGFCTTGNIVVLVTADFDVGN
jgi:hypothetical protein